MLEVRSITKQNKYMYTNCKPHKFSVVQFSPLTNWVTEGI